MHSFWDFRFQKTKEKRNKSSMNNYWIFEEVDLFSLICPHRYREYKTKHPVFQYKKGDFIYFQGDLSTTIFLVNSGTVKIGFIDKDGEEYITAYLKKGDVFGENIFLNETSRKEFAQAAEKETSICSVTLEKAEELLRANHSFSTKIYKFIGLKLKKIERRYQIMLFRDTRTRVIEFLKDLKDEKDNAIKLINGEILVKNPFSQAEIAKLIGTSRSTFNIIINELETENLISYQKNKVILKVKFLLEI